jgi:thiamine biosynthesis lipoprotein
MRRRTLIAAGALGLGSLIVPPGAAAAGVRLHRGAALAFGTTVAVAVRHADGGVARRAIAAALEVVGQVHRLMSIYDPASAVSVLNRDGMLRRPDARLLEVLQHARALSRLSQGAFDITVQPLWQAGRRAAGRGGVPTREERERARLLTGWQDVEANSEQVVLRRPGMAITLNGLAQGYAADLALRAVRRHGIHDALLDTGEFAPAGSAGERPWMLGVLDPRAAQGLAAAFAADGRCVATSGDYQSAFTADFRHHHIVDPATGESPPELASVTVLAPSALEADGLSTTFMVIGARRAHALAARLPGVDLLTIDKRGYAWRSQGFPELRS